MKTWTEPDIPCLGELPELRLFDSSTGEMVRIGSEVRASGANAVPRLYTCGITPYDATHLGHAFTYVCADTLMRYWIAGGKAPLYAQNITDIDDPLFERARDTEVNWRELADSQIELFRSDMELLEVQPPRHWVAVSEIVDELEAEVRQLEARGMTYRLGSARGSEDIYLDLAGDPKFASAPVFRKLDLAREFDEHGGDSTRPGKRHPLDPMIWKGVRGNDFQPAGLEPGAWRPGWHIECAVIARDHLGTDITVQAGGRDLLFPHHEMSESHLRELTDGKGRVQLHFHVGMVAYDGEKMSKSLGNLVRVSQLVERGVDPQVVRLVLLAHHYRADWEYTEAELNAAGERLELWRGAAAALRQQEQAQSEAESQPAEPLSEAQSQPAQTRGGVQALAERLADDLDTPGTLKLVDEIARAGRLDAGLLRAIKALLGIDLLR